MKKQIIPFAFMLLSSVAIYADDLDFYHINETYGISVRETTSICKDADGFVWVAAKTGVLRLTDGDYRMYQLPYESTAVVSVEVVYERNQLYAFTNQGQIFKYNPRLDRFERYANLAKLIDVANPWLFDLETDDDGGLWIAASGGLLYQKNGKCTRIFEVAGTVNDMVRYDDRHLIAAGTSGIYFIDTEQKTVERWSGQIDIRPVSLLLDTEMNRLWIGSMSNGLYYFDYATKTLHEAAVENFPQQCIKDLELVSDSTIWCGIDGRGVWVLSRDGSRVIEVYKEDPDNPHSIRGNGVYDMYYESPGRIWVCSFTGGVSVAELASPVITHLQHRINNPNSLVNNHVHALVEDSRGLLWMGTNSGLSCWNPKTDQWTTFFEERRSEAFIILALCEDGDGNIWVGTYAHGVYVIDGKRLRPVACHTRPTGILSKTGFVFDILRDKNNDMWLAGTSGEILKYNHRNREFEVYPREPVYAMSEWNDHTLLLACNYGLRTLNKNTKAMTTLLTDNMIQDIAVVQEKVWAGSNGGGLMSYDMRTHEIKKYTTHDGLVSNFVNSVLYVDGYLWLGTENGICRFNTIDKTITTYPSPRLISAVSYNTDACFRLRNGQFAWGTSDGVLLFDPRSLSQQKPIGHIYLQDILLSGQSIREYPDLLPTQSLDSIHSITLDYKQNNVTLNVLPLGNYSRMARLSWRMSGVDDKWSDPADQHIISYTNLNPGTYRLSIRLFNHEQVSERTLTIHISPPFWATWWFRLLGMVLAAGLVYFLLRSYINRLNRQHAEDKLRFFTNTAHDLRTALTLIKAPIEEVNHSETLSEHDREYLHLAVEQTRRLTSVATQLLNFQKMDMGKEQFYPVMVDMVVLVGSRISMFESMAATKQITITYRHDADSYFTAVDPDMMERVVDNLLSNAVKYSHEQSAIEVCFLGGDTDWQLTVTDHGIGISRKAQSKLFNEFYRSDNAINAKVVGSGIGLLMAKSLVEIHDGLISVESEEGKGSTFEIKIPRRQSETVAESKLPPTGGEVLTGDEFATESEDVMRILIVEDNDDLRNFMIRPLSRFFRVATATNGEEAWGYIQQEIPDLIVSDIMMPRMDGFELCRRVKSTFDTSHIPIILLTALCDRTDELRGLGLGADDYMTKPFDVQMLAQRITSIIRNRRMVDAKQFATRQSADASTEEPVNPLNEAFMKRALEVVMLHLDNSIFGKEDFAKEMNMSGSLLFKKIKALTGLSVIDFIRSVRMEHAMKLIKEKRYNIGEIARECGFSSFSYFCFIFKRHFGVSPTDV